QLSCLSLMVANTRRDARLVYSQVGCSTLRSRARLRSPEIFAMQACMCAALIDYALCGGRRAQKKRMKSEWDVESAISTYNVDGWGTGYFSINAAGNAEVR